MSEGPVTQPLTGNTAATFRGYVTRIGKLEGDKAEIVADIKDIYADAKATGFDVKILRGIVKLHMADAEARAKKMAAAETAGTVTEIYMAAMGWVGDGA